MVLSNDQSLLEKFNEGLLDIREAFHKTGRLEDSNSKLDEIAKLIAVELASVLAPTMGIQPLRSIISDSGSGTSLVERLNSALSKAATLDLFRNTDGESLLGRNPQFSLAPTESSLLSKLATLIVDTFDSHLRCPKSPKTFELVNEAFGHFVRDNFRNNIEDAQYMTPPEVVDFMCELGADAILGSHRGVDADLVVCDPSCGVGSFLAQFNRVWLSRRCAYDTKLLLVGQDKVDRMARLAKLNLLMFGNKDARISRGNSVLDGSMLDDFTGACDLILTNPPFGARFHSTELAFENTEHFPCFRPLIQATDVNIDSELLFVDRYISLLKPGGSALVVVPDAVVSAQGLPAMLRDYLGHHCSLQSVTDLPATTFAQAGTRTKTSVLHFRKEPFDSFGRTYFSIARSLGFEVASRKGVPYKKAIGTNDLPNILQAIRIGEDNIATPEVAIHSEVPSCVSLSTSEALSEYWTANQHSADRYLTLEKLAEGSAKGGTKLVRLGEMVNSLRGRRKGISITPGARCISVLHVGDFGSLNIRELMAYEPKYPGQVCMAGDILFSKINPRIPRSLVVPELGLPLTCSSEFEVMTAKEPYCAYEIMLLLLTTHAQKQIQALTSGTSSSHNRIKSDQLLNIHLPLPLDRDSIDSPFHRAVEEFRYAHQALVEASRKLNASWEAADAMLYD